MTLRDVEKPTRAADLTALLPCIAPARIPNFRLIDLPLWVSAGAAGGVRDFGPPPRSFKTSALPSYRDTPSPRFSSRRFTLDEASGARVKTGLLTSTGHPLRTAIAPDDDPGARAHFFDPRNPEPGFASALAECGHFAERGGAGTSGRAGWGIGIGMMLLTPGIGAGTAFYALNGAWHPVVAPPIVCGVLLPMALMGRELLETFDITSKPQGVRRVPTRGRQCMRTPEAASGIWKFPLWQRHE